MKPAKPVDDDTPEDEAKPISKGADEAAADNSGDDDDDAPEVATPKVKVPKVKAPSATAGEAEVPRVDVSEVDAKDEVLVTMYETIDPAPRIGTYNIQQIHGIKALIARKNYRFPKYVAEVLVDAKKAEYLQVS